MIAVELREERLLSCKNRQRRLFVSVKQLQFMLLFSS